MSTPRQTTRYRQVHIDALFACVWSARQAIARGNRVAADFALRCAIAEARLARIL